MQICQIPHDTASAVDNMAIDATMLEFGKSTDQCMWRMYGWTEPAITFGYSQKWEWIRLNVAPFQGSCVRRMTGGGIVDHRHDLTYAISIPQTHPAHHMPALELYRNLHQRIAEILMDMGIKADLAPCEDGSEDSPLKIPSGICFQAPEPYDVIDPLSGHKLAGAAMKRNQSGVLIQGSLAMQSLVQLNSTTFEKNFGAELSAMLETKSVSLRGTLPLESLLRERERFGSTAWNQRR